jgi:hypothetical protein
MNSFQNQIGLCVGVESAHSAAAQDRKLDMYGASVVRARRTVGQQYALGPRNFYRAGAAVEGRKTGVSQFFRGPKQQPEECRVVRWRMCRPERGRGRRTRPEIAAA